MVPPAVQLSSHPINSGLCFLKISSKYIPCEQTIFLFPYSPSIRRKSGKTARESQKQLLFRDGFGKIIVLGGLVVFILGVYGKSGLLFKIEV
jgi:hypothetical protein